MKNLYQKSKRYSYICSTLLLIVVCLSNSYAQLDTTFVPKQYAVKFAPNKLLLRVPTIQFGIEKRLNNKRQAISTDLGFVVTNNAQKLLLFPPDQTDTYYHIRGLKVKPAFRYYLEDLRLKFVDYIGVEYTYRLDNIYIREWRNRNNNTFQSYEKYNKYIHYNALSLIWGTRVRHEDDFISDLEIGIGPILRSLYYHGFSTPSLEPTNLDLSGDPFLPLNPYSRERKGTRIHLLIQITYRLGLSF